MTETSNKGKLDRKPIQALKERVGYSYKKVIELLL